MIAKYRFPVLILIASLFLSGCGLFGDDGLIRNRGADYLEAREMPPLVVPENLDREALGQVYAIPEIDDTTVLQEDLGAPRPEPLTEKALEEVVKIQSLENERWILTNRAPSEVWPRIRNILNRSSIPTARAEASEGVIETVWLKFKDDETYQHRFRFYVQPGVQLDSTEIKVLHDRAPREGEDIEHSWPDESDVDERELQMVKLMAETMAADVTSGTVSLLAQTIGGEKKVDIVNPKVADPYLLMKLDFNRAWASVGYSLQRGNYTLVDQNRSEGVFYVHYSRKSEEEDDGGWFSGWFGGDDDEKLDANYRVVMTEVGDGIQVRVVTADQSSPDRNLALRLLKDLRANLS